jgi:hypothetical protein
VWFTPYADGNQRRWLQGGDFNFAGTDITNAEVGTGSWRASLPLSKAVQLAEQWARNEYKRYESVRVHSISLGEYGCPDQKGHWYYTVYFSPVIDGNVLFGSGHFAAVLMNGVVVGPSQAKGNF